MKKIILILPIVFAIAFVSCKKEMKYYHVGFSVEVVHAQGKIDTLNFIDSLCLSSPKVEIIKGTRISHKDVLSINYRGHKDTLIVDSVLTYYILEFPKAILIGDCPEEY